MGCSHQPHASACGPPWARGAAAGYASTSSTEAGSAVSSTSGSNSSEGASLASSSGGGNEHSGGSGGEFVDPLLNVPPAAYAEFAPEAGQVPLDVDAMREAVMKVCVCVKGF